MTVTASNVEIVEYSVFVPHLPMCQLDSWLEDLARGHLSTQSEEYQDLKKAVRKLWPPR